MRVNYKIILGHQAHVLSAREDNKWNYIRLQQLCVYPYLNCCSISHRI